MKRLRWPKIERKYFVSYVWTWLGSRPEFKRCEASLPKLDLNDIEKSIKDSIHGGVGEITVINYKFLGWVWV